ncbi:46000_t:CDS:2 [Gigaspora margarita]|uniref:46000_t:CDS:1 n=1 Tax=Gigaspora margarita TaxID=4874 RepID=A0ABN7UBR9_GIGMA|nr:46000_t:CDS:2 [Gigaspora margarita]
MEDIVPYKNIFTNKEIDVQIQMQALEHNASCIDKNIAKWLGLRNHIAICLIRQVVEIYRWIEFKKAAKKELCREEIEFTSGVEIEDNNKCIADPEDWCKRPSDSTGINGNLNKSVLIETECGVSDYGTKEIKLKHIENFAHIEQTYNEVLVKATDKTGRKHIQRRMEVDETEKFDVKEGEGKFSSNTNAPLDIRKNREINRESRADFFRKSSKIPVYNTNRKQHEDFESTKYNGLLNQYQTRRGKLYIPEAKLWSYTTKQGQTRTESRGNYTSGEVQKGRRVWNVKIAGKEEWKAYKEQLWKNLNVQDLSRLIGFEAEHKEKDIAQYKDQIDKIWDIVEAAILDAAKNTLPFKMIKSDSKKYAGQQDPQELETKDMDDK